MTKNLKFKLCISMYFVSANSCVIQFFEWLNETGFIIIGLSNKIFWDRNPHNFRNSPYIVTIKSAVNFLTQCGRNDDFDRKDVMGNFYYLLMSNNAFLRSRKKMSWKQFRVKVAIKVIYCFIYWWIGSFLSEKYSF